MKATQVALAQNSRGQAVELLKRYRSDPGEDDLRGIEWRYLWQAAQGDEVFTWQHPSMMIGARFSPDGQFVVSDCFDGFLRVWDVKSSKPVTQVQREAHSNFGTMSFCFSPDGRTVAMTQEGTIVLLDTADWHVARRLELFVGRAEGRVGFPPLAWSPNGEWLAACLSNGLRLWSTADWTTTLLPRRAGGGHIAFAPDSRTLAGCSPDAIELWDVFTKEKLRELPGAGRVLAISPDGQRLAAGSRNGQLELWNLRTGEAQWTNQAHRSTIMALAFSSDGQRLASGAFDQVIHLWDVAKQAKVQTLRGHLNEVWSLDFSPDDRYLVSASKDGTVKLWDTRVQKRPTRWWMETKDSFLGFSSDGRRLITITTNGTSLHHWDGPEVSKAVPLPEPLSAVELNSALLSSKGGSLVVVSTNGTLRTYSVDTGRSIRPAVKLAGEFAGPYRLSPGDRWLAGVARTADGAWGFQLWDTTSGASAGQFPPAVEFHFAITFSRDDRLLAVASTNATVQVWDLSKTNLIHSFQGHSWAIQGLAFSRDGRYLASSGADGDVRVWDITAGGEMVAPLRGHGSGVNQVAFSSDGRTLFTGGHDNTVRFWQMPTGREMLLFDRTRDNSWAGPGSAKWSPTDELLALWDFERQDLRVETIPTFTEIEEAERQRERSQ